MPTSAREPLLEISGLSAGYGKIGVLNGIDLTVGAGEVVALLGPNGAGKTTLLRAISGLLPWSGQIRFAGKDLSGASPRDTVRAGLVHVVEGHRVFTQLTVFDNLLLAGYGMPRARAGRAGRGGACLLPRDRRQAQRPRGYAVGRPAANACGGARPGAASSTSDARRAVGRAFAGARRPGARGGGTASRCRHRRAAGRAVDREGARARRSGLRPRARLDRAGGRGQRARPAEPAGACIFRPGDRAWDYDEGRAFFAISSLERPLAVSYPGGRACEPSSSARGAAGG